MVARLTPIDWAAILGVLAWVPHLVTWIRDYFAKPTLALFPAASPEIGFSAYGMVLNLQCAISADVTDAVIERMEAELVHEHGQRFVLPWRGLHETLSEIETPSGEIERHRRQQTALALKVLIEELAEKTVMFQDLDFQNREIEALRSVEVRRDRIAAAEPESTRSSLVLKSDEFAELARVVRAGFKWQAGKYDVVFRLKAAERETPFDFRYRFQLSDTDIDRLKENLELVLANGTASFAPEHKAPERAWNWRYPSMTKSE